MVDDLCSFDEWDDGSALTPEQEQVRRYLLKRIVTPEQLDATQAVKLD